MAGSQPPRVVLLDTNVIIEAVRTNCWNALTGGFQSETVEECRLEALKGDTTRRGYVPVSVVQLERLSKVHVVSDIARATFAMEYEGAAAMDGGERALFAHAHERLQQGDDVWVISSPDKASVRAAIDLEWSDKIVSLEHLVSLVGVRPKPPLDDHHGERWLSTYRTEYLLARKSG